MEVMAGSQALGANWVVLPPECELQILHGTDRLTVRVQANSSSGMSMLDDHDARIAPPENLYAGAIIAGPDGQVVEEPVAQAQAPMTERPSRPPRDYHKLYVALAVLAIAVPMFMLTAMIYNGWQQGRQSKRLRDAQEQFQMLLERGRGEIRSGSYAAAKASLTEAEIMARSGQWENELAEVRVLLAKPEIQFGANGYVQVHGKWVDAGTASAWHEAEEQYDGRIATMTETARTQLRASQFADARTSCAEAMLLMDKFPDIAKPHPALDAVKQLDKKAENLAVAKEMTAKGMVLYKERWMTPEEQFRTQQAEKGLVDYKGKWIAKDEAYALQQAERGLVLYDGKWMTPEQKLQAQGNVQFEGKWVLPAEKVQILAQREVERKAKATEAAQLVETRRRQQQSIEAQKPAAYAMSQVFVKKQLKHPLSAIFPPYMDTSVTVVYKDGWYLVRAVVKAENGIGTLVGREYLSKLRPTVGDKWESELTEISDQ